MAAGDENRSDVSFLAGIRTIEVENLPKEGVTVKEAPDVKEPSLPTIGFYLSKFVLYIIAGFIVLFSVFLSIQAINGAGTTTIPDAGTISDTLFSRKLELVKLAQEETKNDRAYTLQIAQMILLNLLLPVLTAILGYIFGSNRGRE
jgi:hypothetical protein